MRLLVLTRGRSCSRRSFFRVMFTEAKVVDVSQCQRFIYNGVFFDVIARDSPILVTAIHVVGTRGGLRAFATRAAEPQVNAITDWRRWVNVGVASHIPSAERPAPRPGGLSEPRARPALAC